MGSISKGKVRCQLASPRTNEKGTINAEASRDRIARFRWEIPFASAIGGRVLVGDDVPRVRANDCAPTLFVYRQQLVE